MKLRTLVLILAILAIALWYLISSGSGRPAAAHDQLAMVIDNSISQSLNCDSLPAMALDALSGMRVGKRSKVSVFTLGSPATSWEPALVYDGPAPRKGGLFGGSFAADLKRACGSFAQVNSSSIFRAVEVALDHLRGEGCGQQDLTCKLLVESDGEENISHVFYKSGAGAGKGLRLSNMGIQVLWCGYAVTDSGGGPRGERTDKLLARWKASFTAPENVVFTPFCKGGATGAATAASR